MQKFKLIGKPLLGEKYVEGKKKERKKEEERRRRKNNAKFSGHYFRPCTHNVRAHTLRSHQYIDVVLVFITFSSCYKLCPILVMKSPSGCSRDMKT